jgi:hypothetical protein
VARYKCSNCSTAPAANHGGKILCSNLGFSAVIEASEDDPHMCKDNMLQQLELEAANSASPSIIDGNNSSCWQPS